MPGNMQIRNVSEKVHRRLKAQAALGGRSLSDYLLAELRELAERPTPEEMLARLASREPVRLRTRPAEIVRQERDRR